MHIGGAAAQAGQRCRQGSGTGRAAAQAGQRHRQGCGAGRAAPQAGQMHTCRAASCLPLR